VKSKIYVHELECAKQADDKTRKSKLAGLNRYFDIEALPEGIREEMSEYIWNRGEVLRLLSVRCELYPYHQLCQFLTEEYPDIQTFKGIDIGKIVRRCKVWIVRNGKNQTQSHIKTDSGKIEISDADIIKYIRKIYKYFNNDEDKFEFESDVWYLEHMPVKVRDNPTKRTKSISFKKINQQMLKEEVKQVIFVHLSQTKVGTVLAEMSAINRFVSYLRDRYSEVEAFTDIDRDLLESYLIYTNVEATGRKSYANELKHLKAVFKTAANVLGEKKLSHIFYDDDIAAQPETVYKVYSDAELKRLNAAIVKLDVQIARVLIIHQLLGTRISDTLTLRRNAIFKNDKGIWMIRIDQVKTGRSYNKAIDEDVKRLFDKACEYTQKNYGDTEYVFVNAKDYSRPMQYGRIAYQLRAMINRNDLRDDHGERFHLGTHIWRHNYGHKLTECHVDDVTIAKLLGHANTSSIKNYRKIGNKVMANETQDMRSAMDQMIDDILKGW